MPWVVHIDKTQIKLNTIFTNKRKTRYFSLEAKPTHEIQQHMLYAA